MRLLPIAYGNSAHAKTWSNKTITFDELCERLKVTIRTPETVEEYPKLNKTDRDLAKDKGGFVGGLLKDNRRKVDTVVSRSMLTLDVDNADVDFIDKFKSLCKYESCFYTTHSHTPSAPRLRVIIPMVRDVSPDEYIAIARHFANDYGIDQFDECSYKVNQLMYWPSTPSNGEYIFEHISGAWFEPDKYLQNHPHWRDCSLLPTSSRESIVRKSVVKKQEDPLEKQGIIGAFCRTYSIADVIEKYLSDVYSPSVIDGRYDYILGEGQAGVIVYDDKFAYSHHATDPASGKLCNAFDLVRIHMFGNDDSKASFKAMSDFASNDENVKMHLLEERQAQAKEDFMSSENDDAWKKQLEYEPRTMAVKNTLKNLILILQNDPNLKNIVYNLHSDGMEIIGTVPWKHPDKYWRDADDAQLISYIDTNYGVFTARNYDIAVTKVADDRSYHPIRDYLNSLSKWDGVKRIDTLLIDYFGAKDNIYVRSVTRKTLCAAVKRVQVPGIKFDSMLVLCGPQGIGKSTIISKLAGEWFSDSLNLADTKDKTAAEKLQGYWILEIGELAGLRKAETETLRSFISRKNDIYRAAFTKHTFPHLRQCIFFATTNAENGYLRDTTGNRRFWPVKTPGTGTKKSWDITQDDISQIWAEAIHYVEEGESLFLPPEIEAMAKYEQREAMETDEREGLVSDYLNLLLPSNWNKLDLYERRNFTEGIGSDIVKGTEKRTSVSNIEIWCECFNKDRGSLRKSDSNELTSILIKLGWVRKPTKERIPLYGPQYIFVPKECSQANQ